MMRKTIKFCFKTWWLSRGTLLCKITKVILSIPQRYSHISFISTLVTRSWNQRRCLQQAERHRTDTDKYEILFGHKEKWNSDIHMERNGHRYHYDKQNKPESEKDACFPSHLECRFKCTCACVCVYDKKIERGLREVNKRNKGGLKNGTRTYVFWK